jgi:hypothetical protein
MTKGVGQNYIGQTGLLQDVLPGLDVAVRILDMRTAFGRIDVKVTPVSGSGDTWVNINRVQLTKG